jgi:methylmalonyl-CoA mutase
VRYRAEITETARGSHAETEQLVDAARRVQRLEEVSAELADDEQGGVPVKLAEAREALPVETAKQLEEWPSVVREYAEHPGRESLSGNRVPRVALPSYVDHGELVKFWRRENLPGRFPFTAGVFPFKRDNEDPARMFAGEGDPARTNRRFKVLSAGNPATRLSTAFDSVTLYGRDPDERPDIYGKVGTSGVSVATLDDMKELYDGFDLLAPTTSVSMTINGPAPTVLAFFLNTAMDQAREEVNKSTAPEHPGMSEHEAEIADLRTRLAEVEAGYRVSPDHLRRIREELDRLESTG